MGLTGPLEPMTEQDLVAYLNATQGPGWVGDTDPAAWARDAYEVAIFVLAPPAAITLAHVEGLLKYLWTGPLAGEWWDQEGEELASGCLFVFPVDTTKSRRDDLPDAWGAHRGILEEGTPVRTTDRAGPGTKGTRKWAGLGPVLVAWR